MGLTDDAVADQFVHHIASDWRRATLSEIDSALCNYAEKLTSHPTEMQESDVDNLKKLGLNDQAIHDATQVISYFNYINRIADALDVEKETFIHPWEQSAPSPQ